MKRSFDVAPLRIVDEERSGMRGEDLDRLDKGTVGVRGTVGRLHLL